MNVLLKSALIIDTESPFHKQKKDILIENNRISKIGNTLLTRIINELSDLNLHKFTIGKTDN